MSRKKTEAVIDILYQGFIQFIEETSSEGCRFLILLGFDNGRDSQLMFQSKSYDEAKEKFKKLSDVFNEIPWIRI